MTTPSKTVSRRFGFGLARPILWASLTAAIVVLSSFGTAFGADTPVATVPVGNSPAVVAVDPLTHHVFVGNYYGDSVSVIDGTTRSAVATIPMPTGGSIAVPITAVVDGLSGKAYVGNFWSNFVSVIDASTLSVVATISPPASHGSGVRALAADPSGATPKVYAAIFGKNVVSVIDGSTDSVVKNIPVGNSPRAIAVFASGSHRRVYVANRYSNDVSIIDGNTDEVVATVPTGASPKVIAVDPNRGFAYVTSTCQRHGHRDRRQRPGRRHDRCRGQSDRRGSRRGRQARVRRQLREQHRLGHRRRHPVGRGDRRDGRAADGDRRRPLVSEGVRQLLREQFGHHDRQLAGCDIHRHRLSPVRAGHRRGARLASGLQRELGREQRDHHRPARRRRRSGQRGDRPPAGRHHQLDVPGVLGHRRQFQGASTVQHRRGVLPDRRRSDVAPRADRRRSRYAVGEVAGRPSGSLSQGAHTIEVAAMDQALAVSSSSDQGAGGDSAALGGAATYQFDGRVDADGHRLVRERVGRLRQQPRRLPGVSVQERHASHAGRWRRATRSTSPPDCTGQRPRARSSRST